MSIFLNQTLQTMPETNLPFIQQNMSRYGMTIDLVLGLIGNFCNLIMFTHHTHRRSASSIYFLALSIFAIMYLSWAVIPIIYTLDHPDLQTQSLFYCKVRLYSGHSLGLCLRYIIVCACADRFFVTRTNVRIRSLSSVSTATKLVLMTCLACFMIPIHVPILMDLRDGICGMFGLYRVIYAFYQIISIGILPPVLMSIFSILTIRSLHQRHGIQLRTRQIDRYLMRMVIAEVIVNIFTSIPYSLNLIYGAATYYVTGKSAQRLEIESFISFLTQFLIYLISVTPFYLFILTSKPFRHEFINIFIQCWNKYIQRGVRIAPSV